MSRVYVVVASRGDYTEMNLCAFSTEKKAALKIHELEEYSELLSLARDEYFKLVSDRDKELPGSYQDCIDNKKKFELKVREIEKEYSLKPGDIFESVWNYSMRELSLDEE